mgnify:FL=1
MDLWLELLSDPAYRHVLLNHVPITGLAASWLVLGWAVFDRRWATTVFALSLVTLASAAAQPIMSAGDAAYPFVFETLDGDGRHWLDHHVWLAERWAPLLWGNAALGVAAIALGTLREQTRRAVSIVVLVTTVSALLAASVIAEAGGKIRHAEFRLEDPPIHDEPGRLPRP